MPDIFKKRTNYKPFEYPEISKFTDMINKSFWVHSELDFTADIQDFHAHLEPHEKEAIKRSLLPIAQIEVAVKSFWGDLYKHLPKPEFNGLGSTFAECHVEGTEILTPEGWLDFRDLKQGDRVIQYDTKTCEYSTVVPSNIVNEKYTGTIYKIDNGSNFAMLTPNHRIIYKTLHGIIRERKIKDIKSLTSSMKLPYIGRKTGEVDNLSDLDRLKIAIQADGCERFWRNKKGTRINRGLSTGCNTYELTFKKEKKIERLRELLKNTGVTYREYNISEKELTRFEVDMPKSDYSHKSFEWVDLENKSHVWCNEFIEELLKWDGHNLIGKHNNKTCIGSYSTTSKENADIVQAIGMFAAYRSNLTVHEDKRKETYNDIYKVNFLKRDNFSSTVSDITEEQYEGTIHCVTVPTGCIVTRLNNKVLISGNCEFRHSEAYSQLLSVLGYDDEFRNLVEEPVIKKRIEYLNKALQHSNSDDPKKYVFSLILFSILIENVSLFSQFGIVLSFTRFKGYMKNVSNIIAWTSVDEQVHANAGIYIINQIKNENPDFFDENIKQEISNLIEYSISVESEILDWIFEKGEIECISKKDLVNFMKFRADESLTNIGLDKIFNITSEEYKPMQWFEEEVFANSLDDFFAKRPVEYTKHDKSITANDLF